MGRGEGEGEWRGEGEGRGERGDGRWQKGEGRWEKEEGHTSHSSIDTIDSFMLRGLEGEFQVVGSNWLSVSDDVSGCKKEEEGEKEHTQSLQVLSSVVGLCTLMEN